MEDFFKQIICDTDGKYSVVIEDNGQVCYAYLLEDKEIISDVWLYNSAETPITTDWGTSDDMPFMNPRSFSHDENRIIIEGDLDQALVNWKFIERKLEKANLVLNGQLIAILKPGAKPGWSINAKNDGPLAKPLFSEHN